MLTENETPDVGDDITAENRETYEEYDGKVTQKNTTERSTQKSLSVPHRSIGTYTDILN